MIKKGSVVRNSIIMKQSFIGENVTIDKAIIAENVTVGNNVVMGVGEDVPNKENQVYTLWFSNNWRKFCYSGRRKNRN